MEKYIDRFNSLCKDVFAESGYAETKAVRYIERAGYITFNFEDSDDISVDLFTVAIYTSQKERDMYKSDSDIIVFTQHDTMYHNARLRVAVALTETVKKFFPKATMDTKHTKFEDGQDKFEIIIRLNE